MKKGLDARVAVFRPVDLLSDERTKLEDQIMERALALWARKQGQRSSPFNVLRRAGREVSK
jgi:hypothetical protein